MDDEVTFDPDDVIAVATYVAEAFDVTTGTYLPVAVQAIADPAGEHVIIGDYSFSTDEARRLAASIVNAADALDHKVILG